MYAASYYTYFSPQFNSSILRGNPLRAPHVGYTTAVVSLDKCLLSTHYNRGGTHVSEEHQDPRR